MKIRLAILEKDKSYLNRIVSVFNAKYADKLEIYSFTEKENAFEALRKYHVDVFLAGKTIKLRLKWKEKKIMVPVFLNIQRLFITDDIT